MVPVMKLFLAILTLALVIPCVTLPARSAPARKIAVAGNMFDKVESVLNHYRIDYDLIEYKDLERRDIIGRYRALYLPCGMDYPYESMINVRSVKTRISSVTLKPDIREVNSSVVAENLGDFTGRGGAIYASGYSFKVIQEAFDIFTYHDDFPYMGMPGRVECGLAGDLRNFCGKDMMALYFSHPGWIALKSAGGCDVIATAEYETPRGIRKGPVSVLHYHGRGTVLYTAYHGTVYSDFRRFNILRVAGNHIIAKLGAEARKYGQTITGMVADEVLGGENVRVFGIGISRGRNTVYFLSERD